jgi:hypothetical protein
MMRQRHFNLNFKPDSIRLIPRYEDHHQNRPDARVKVKCKGVARRMRRGRRKFDTFARECSPENFNAAFSGQTILPGIKSNL